jgi:AcrR family transcriptional regulator
MSVPSRESPACWSNLDPQEKRSRLLLAAGEVFAREGLDAPMPAIAAAAGAGIGSVYRQFSSKRELLAALVVERTRSRAQPGRGWRSPRFSGRWPNGRPATASSLRRWRPSQRI